LQNALLTDELAKSHQLVASANMLVVTDIALSPLVLPAAVWPSLYWLRDDPAFPEAVIIASNHCLTAIGTVFLNRAFSVWEKTLTSKSISKGN